jgi:hypothetical protein
MKLASDEMVMLAKLTPEQAARYLAIRDGRLLPDGTQVPVEARPLWNDPPAATGPKMAPVPVVVLAVAAVVIACLWLAP